MTDNYELRKRLVRARKQGADHIAQGATHRNSCGCLDGMTLSAADRKGHVYFRRTLAWTEYLAALDLWRELYD